MQRAEQLTSNAYAEHRARLLEAYRNQARLVDAGAIVSPYLAIRAVSAALAGSDMAHQLEFEEQAEAFRYRLIQALNDLHINEVETARDRYAQVNGAPTRQRIDASFFDRLPTFEFRPPRVAQALRSQATALTAALAAALLLMAAFAWTAVRAARLG
jgi:ABC-2 type transport system permease protein